MSDKQSANVGKTLLGILLAFVTWLVVFVTAHVLLYLLDYLRGLSDDWLQSLFREWFTPGVGGYAAIYVVDRFLTGANLKWVAIGFCTPIVAVFIGLSIYLMIFHGDKLEFSWGDQITNWGMSIATSVGAYIAYKNYAD
jgi:hypothetical protein